MDNTQENKETEIDEEFEDHEHSYPVFYPKIMTIQENKVPVDEMYPLTFNKDHHTKRNLEEIINVSHI